MAVEVEVGDEEFAEAAPGFAVEGLASRVPGAQRATQGVRGHVVHSPGGQLGKEAVLWQGRAGRVPAAKETNKQ